MNTLAYDAAAITAVIGYTDKILTLWPSLRKYGVLVSCGFGVLYAVAMRPGTHELVGNLSSGVMIGLAASGGFAGMKNYVETRRKS